MRKLLIATAFVSAVAVLATVAMWTRQGAEYKQAGLNAPPVQIESDVQVAPAPVDIEELEKSVAATREHLDQAHQMVKEQLSMLDSISDIEDKYDRGDLTAEDYLRLKEEVQVRYLGASH